MGSGASSSRPNSLHRRRRAQKAPSAVRPRPWRGLHPPGRLPRRKPGPASHPGWGSGTAACPDGASGSWESGGRPRQTAQHLRAQRPLGVSRPWKPFAAPMCRGLLTPLRRPRRIAGPWKWLSVTARLLMAWRKTPAASAPTWWAPIPGGGSWPPSVPGGAGFPASSLPTWRDGGVGRGPVTRWPHASLPWRGPAVQACRRRAFFPSLGFSPLWPKISRRLIHQGSLRLKAVKLMSRDKLLHVVTVGMTPGL